MTVKELLQQLDLQSDTFGVLANDKKAGIDQTIYPEDRIVIMPVLKGEDTDIEDAKHKIIQFFTQVNKRNFFDRYYEELLEELRSGDLEHFFFSEKGLAPNDLIKYHKSWSLTQWEGIIYRVKQVRNLDGTKISTPKYVYIGLTTTKLSKRKGNELKRARELDFGPRDAFSKTMSEFSTTTTNMKDAFEWEVIDICYSMEELHAKEAFWTKYYNEETSHTLLNYYTGPPSWGQSADLVSYNDLLDSILAGDEIEDMERKFSRAETSIRNYMDKYFIDDTDPEIQGIMHRTNSKGIRASRVIALKPWFDAALEAGLDAVELWDLLEKNNIQLLIKQYYGSQEVRKGIAINKYSRDLYGKLYSEVRLDRYLRPAIDRLQDHGIKIIGKGTDEIEIEDFLDLFDRSRKNKVGRGYSGETTKWGLIEWLAFSGLPDAEIANLLGLDGSPGLVKVRSYYGQRHGFTSGVQFRRFLHNNYLGSSGI